MRLLYPTQLCDARSINEASQVIQGG